MNRLKVWLLTTFMLVVGAASVAALSRWLADRALSEVDEGLRADVGLVDARAQLLAGEAGQLAGFLSRDPTTVQRVAAGEGDAAGALRAAAATAEAGAPERSRPLLVALAARGELQAWVGERALPGDGAAGRLVAAAAAAGEQREGHVGAGEGIYYLVAVPLGKDAAVGVGVPLGPIWARVVQAATGADLTLCLGERPVTSTLPPAQAAAVAGGAARAGGGVGSAGALGAVRPFGELVPVPLPVLLWRVPALRFQAIALKGLPEARAVLSTPTAGRLGPVIAVQWAGVVLLFLLGVAGVLTGLSVTNEQRAVIPKELVGVADRIARGDFTARAGDFAGSLGTVAAALNRAAEAAGRGAAPQASAPAGEEPEAKTDPWATLGAPSAGEPARPAAEPPPRPAAAPPQEVAQPAPATPPAAPVEPAAPAEPAAHEPLTQAGVQAAAASPTEGPPPGARPEITGEVTLTHLPVAGAPLAPADPDEEHWRAVYQEFVASRARMGEPPDALSYDRFRQKLLKNRDQLVAKYGCRTVRFQVHVKDGRTGLKASPVR